MAEYYTQILLQSPQYIQRPTLNPTSPPTQSPYASWPKISYPDIEERVEWPRPSDSSIRDSDFATYSDLIYLGVLSIPKSRWKERPNY